MKLPVKRHEVIQPLDKPYRYIPLTRNQTAIVDVEDFERISAFNWFSDWNRDTKTYYARRSGSTGGVRMHNFILNAKRVDHKNHDTLDNRRDNLRKSTRIQNGQNRRLNRNSTSGFKGVSWHKYVKKWTAYIRINKRLTFIGYFPTPKDAAHAYDEKAKELFGEFAHLNFPESTTHPVLHAHLPAQSCTSQCLLGDAQ